MRTLALVAALVVALQALLPQPARVVLDVPYRHSAGTPGALAAVGMVLEYHGFNYSHPYLVLLAGAYAGMYYDPLTGYGCGYSPDPLTAIERVLGALGFEYERLEFPNASAGLPELKDYLSRGEPVIIQWMGAPVVAVGYDDGRGVVYVHDPGGGPEAYAMLLEHALTGLSYVPPEALRYMVGGGELLEVEYDVMERFWFTPWLNRSLALVVVPPEGEPRRPALSDVLGRLASNMLGEATAYGAAGYRAALSLATHMKWMARHLRGDVLLNVTYRVKKFVLDTAYPGRLELAAALAGMYLASGRPELARASALVRRAGEHYALASALLGYGLVNSSALPDALLSASDHVRAAAHLEREAGELLKRLAAGSGG